MLPRMGSPESLCAIYANFASRTADAANHQYGAKHEHAYDQARGGTSLRRTIYIRGTLSHADLLVPMQCNRDTSMLEHSGVRTKRVERAAPHPTAAIRTTTRHTLT